VIWNKVVLEVKGDPSPSGGVTHLVLDDTVTGEKSDFKVDGMFVFIGFKPNTGLIKEHFNHDAFG
jgi:thioredoxin reductase (NADPH)